MGEECDSGLDDFMFDEISDQGFEDSEDFESLEIDSDNKQEPSNQPISKPPNLFLVFRLSKVLVLETYGLTAIKQLMPKRN